MENITEKSILNNLSPIATEKLSLVPKWVEQNHPELSGSSYEVMEGGTMSLIVNVGDKLVLKIFVPKQESRTDYPKDRDIFLGNYLEIQRLGLSLASFGVISLEPKDSVLEAPVLTSKFVNNSTTLVRSFYDLNNLQKNQTIIKIVQKLKKFHQSFGTQYSTQRILDKFDYKLQLCENNIPREDLKKFKQLRNHVQAKNIENEIVLVHCDLNLGNIMVDNSGNIEFIDFDFSHFAPRFAELEKLFLFTFFPRSVVPLNLEQYYNESMSEVFEQFISEYSELWNEQYILEIKLILATQIVQKYNKPEFQSNLKVALDYFWQL